MATNKNADDEKRAKANKSEKASEGENRGQNSTKNVEKAHEKLLFLVLPFRLAWLAAAAASATALVCFVVFCACIECLPRKCVANS